MPQPPMPYKLSLVQPYERLVPAECERHDRRIAIPAECERHVRRIAILLLLCPQDLGMGPRTGKCSVDVRYIYCVFTMAVNNS